MKNLFSLSLLAVGLLTTSCSPDTSYSLSSIDATVGIEADSLDIPQNSTAKITLSDILEINDANNTISYDSDSNYVFERVGDKITTTNCKVNNFSLAKRIIKGYNVDVVILDNSSASKMKRTNAKAVVANGKLQDFNYSATIPSDVNYLESVEIESNMKLSVRFPEGLSSIIPTIDYIKISVPNFLTYKNLKCSTDATIEDDVITIKNVPSDKELIIDANVTGIDCSGVGCKNGTITQENSKLTIVGDVSVDLYASNPDLNNTDKLKSKVISSQFVLTDMVVKKAVGKFSPKLDAVSIGQLSISGLPSFMTESNVVADLDNVFVFLTVNSDLPMDGYVGGTIKAIKNKKEVAAVEVPEFKVNAAGETLVCICKKATPELKLKYICVEVPNISEIIKPVPDAVDFTGKGRADNTVLSTVEVGKEYSISSSYKVSANVAFGEEAVIVSSKTFKGISSGVDKLDLGKDSRLTLTAKAINTIPLYCTVKASLIDKAGKEINGIKIITDETTILPSFDGKTPSTAQIKIEVIDETANVLKKIDGIKVAITGKSKADGKEAVTGVVLNGARQYIEFSDININVDGKIIYNANN